MSQILLSADASANEVFASACKAFHASLSDEEKKQYVQFSDAVSMIENITKRCDDHPIHKSRLTRCCKQIERLTKKLSPYFQIIDIFIQTNPEYAGLVWGSIRLIFQLGSNYTVFLEKLTHMFERMTAALPAYGDYVDLIQRRATFQWSGKESKQIKDLSEASNKRLLKGLAHVYADVLQFCQKACRLLSNEKGVRHRAVLMRDLNWKPFDSHFSEIIERFTEHCQIFEREMKVSMESQLTTLLAHFQEVEERSVRAEEQQRKRELELLNLSHAALVKQKEEAMRVRIRELKGWINAPEWQDKLDDTLNCQTPGTCDWLFSEPSFMQWLNGVQYPHKSSSSMRESVLLVQGKPGYGKTYLCAHLIKYLERLLPSAGQMPSNAQPKPTVLFYFFDKRGERAVNLLDGFRAVLAQLMHVHQRDRDMIDIASLIMDVHGKGQLIASKEEILSLLALLLKRYPGAILVFDGIDECLQHEEFLKCLQDVTCVQSSATNGPGSPGPMSFGQAASNGDTIRVCGIALFSRPSIRVPEYMLQHSLTTDLAEHQNLEDIITYMMPKVQTLLIRGLLPQDRSLQHYVDTISTHANGMFLWTRLLMEYLESEALSLQDRLDALDSIISLEGLDAMYATILKNLQEKHPERARQNIKSMFHWVAGAMRPLHVSEIYSALNPSVGKNPADREAVLQFRNALPRMSGALLELSLDQSVRFIHASVVDYLQRGQDTFSQARHGSTFQSSNGQTQLFIAWSCLRYINEYIPPGPLGGSSQITADKNWQRETRPLLDYAVKYWASHICNGLKTLLRNSHSDCRNPSLYELITEVSKFVRSKMLVTTWIEACYTMGQPPSLANLPAVIGDPELQSIVPQQYRRPLPTLVSELERFERNLKSLDRAWGHILTVTPNELWEPSIAAFTKSDFWVQPDEATTSSLINEAAELKSSVLVHSQVSDDGTEVGLVKLIPPRSLPAFNRMCDLGMPLDGWQAHYEIWSLQTKQVKVTFSVEIPRDDMEALLCKDMKQYIDAKFDYYRITNLHHEFPVALAGDLRKVFLLRFLLTIHRDDADIGSELELGQGLTCFRLSFWPGTLSKQEPIKLALRFYSLRALFSPSGNHLLILRPSLENRSRVHLKPKGLDLDIFKNSGELEVLSPAYSLSLPGHSLPMKEFGFYHFDRFFAFHPFLPLVAFTDDSTTAIWRFSVTGSQPIQVHDASLKELKFSTCGGYVHGFADLAHGGEDLVIIDLTPHMNSSTQISTSSLDANNSNSLIPTAGSSSLTLQALSIAKPRPTQKLNAISFSRSPSGAAQMTALRAFEEQGAVVLHSLRDDGTVRSETLSRVPKEISLTGAVLVPPGVNRNGERIIRLVLNKPPQKFIELGLRGQGVYPLVIERTQTSIVGAEGNVRGIGGIRTRALDGEEWDGRRKKAKLGGERATED